MKGRSNGMDILKHKIFKIAFIFVEEDTEAFFLLSYLLSLLYYVLLDLMLKRLGTLSSPQLVVGSSD